jgi:hypothetical protein
MRIIITRFLNKIVIGGAQLFLGEDMKKKGIYWYEI